MENYEATLTELTKTNQLGGFYLNGKPLPNEIRYRVIQLAEMGVRPCEISRQLRVTHGCISKLLAKFYETGSLDPGTKNVGRPKVITPEIEMNIDKYRDEQPGIFSWELRERLVKDKVCTPDNVPSLSSISRFIKGKILEDAAKDKRISLQQHSSISITNSELEQDVTSRSRTNSCDTNSTMQRGGISHNTLSRSTGSADKNSNQRNQWLSFSIEAILNKDLKRHDRVENTTSPSKVETFSKSATLTEKNCHEIMERRTPLAITYRKVKRSEREFKIKPYPVLKKSEEKLNVNEFKERNTKEVFCIGGWNAKRLPFKGDSQTKHGIVCGKCETNPIALSCLQCSSRFPIITGPSRIYFPSKHVNPLNFF